MWGFLLEIPIYFHFITTNFNVFYYLLKVQLFSRRKTTCDFQNILQFNFSLLFFDTPEKLCTICLQKSDYKVRLFLVNLSKNFADA